MFVLRCRLQERTTQLELSFKVKDGLISSKDKEVALLKQTINSLVLYRFVRELFLLWDKSLIWRRDVHVVTVHACICASLSTENFPGRSKLFSARKTLYFRGKPQITRRNSNNCTAVAALVVVVELFV